jgi:hypothetical protein
LDCAVGAQSHSAVSEVFSNFHRAFIPVRTERRARRTVAILPYRMK